MERAHSRRLGQYFLKNREKLRKIAACLEIANGDTIVEIGPGHGELTKELVAGIENLEFRLIAIEKDEKLARGLQEKFKNHKSIQIVHGDALKILPELKIVNCKLKITGNIPYYITGKLLRTIGDLITNYKLPITTCVLTVQKEVAERICAKPPHMNLLAAAVRFWAEPKIIDYISKKDFKPQPDVDSAVVKFEIRNSKFEIQDSYYKLVRILFKQPRKTILNNLSVFKPKEEILPVLEKMGVNPGLRPQNLSVEDIKLLSRVL
ncbi:MAG TPA: 16S rRNA (adenine(1518)-N(6)/adenine(1519)-N(6))-dimethyltransferase RsmA [Candidatus Paceibacterota bacterium]|nr:16S rRNA (adenine(1518)-N(6)/adenine(1519)-N(6))-dimethyltransferase RsmA [Candidatus Paceibacterota bacterium]